MSQLKVTIEQRVQRIQGVELIWHRAVWEGLTGHENGRYKFPVPEWYLV
jgi:hypothetical protein